MQTEQDSRSAGKPAGRARRIAALMLLAGFGLGTMVALRAPGPNPAPSVEATAEVAAQPEAPASGSEPAVGSERASLDLGRAIYEQHCASCHGLRGEGQPNWKVPNADGSLPAPPHDASGHTWHHADQQLLDIIAQGGKIYMPESTMPGYADLLTQAEMEAVLAYIKRWWGPEELEFQAKVSESWPTAAAP